MPKLDRVILINSAGFDYLEFPVGGHSQVIGVNGHGKSTLLRTVLFFYLGTNDKAPYALHETKSDFVSHYLGEPPSYLIYEITRDVGQPSFHVAVTRPSGRIQFHFVDAPFEKSYYLDGTLVQSIEGVQQRWRDARCSCSLVNSYDEFNRRVYGLAPSPFSVYRPAPRSSGQISILPRIISGIFTVSQLDADKLKAALTCGVREDSLATELDLLLLKSQLENFRRVNGAVKTYLRFENDALQLVDVAEEFEEAKNERIRAIEDLVRMGKRLPEKEREIVFGESSLATETKIVLEQYQAEKSDLESVIKRSGEQIAVFERQIQKGDEIHRDYEARQIDRKAAEVATLATRREEQKLAEGEYEALTTKYHDENQRKDRMLANITQAWTELSRQYAHRRGEAERVLNLSRERLDVDRTTALNALEEERGRSKASINSRRAGLEYVSTKLKEDFKAMAGIRPPDELRKAENDLQDKRKKQQAESERLQRLRGEITLEREKRERAREKLDQKAEAEQSNWQKLVDETKSQRERATEELEKFDASLARFFQEESPESWPDASKTLAREVLFTNADDLGAKIGKSGAGSAWGITFSTEKLSVPAASFDRDMLEAKLRELQKAHAHAQDQLVAAQQRYVSDVDEFEKAASQAQFSLQNKIETANDLVRSLSSEIALIDNRIITLNSQFQTHQTEQQGRLDARDLELKKDEQQFRKDEKDADDQFQARKARMETEFGARKKGLLQERDDCLKVISNEEKEAVQQRDADQARIEKSFQESLAKLGVKQGLIAATKQRVEAVGKEITRIEGYENEVIEYQRMKHEFIDPLDSIRCQCRNEKDSLEAEKLRLKGLEGRHLRAMAAFQALRKDLDEQRRQLELDQDAVNRFRGDKRFLLEWGFFDREDLCPAPFYRPGATRAFGLTAESAHENREEVVRRGEKNARAFLNHFDAETLDRKVLGFSPIHEHFNWYIFVGNELRPFVNGRGIQGMKQIQTQEFEQLIRNICAKNADFKEGIRQVKQTAALVQSNLEQNNFVDVLDSIELKVERVDNNLTRILAELEGFAGVTFSADRDLFGKRADREQIDKAIETFARLMREIESYHEKSLRLTDYFDFLIRVHENGHDMGWRKSLDHIGSTGTDYLVKMLIYLSLIEVYRERAIDSKAGSTVHCVLDETGVLAPKYVRSVLEYAKSRGIILLTAGHSQQTVGFDNWVRVRKRGQRFGGQTVLRKVLKCD